MGWTSRPSRRQNAGALWASRLSPSNSVSTPTDPTTAPCLQFYSGNFLDGHTHFKNDFAYKRRMAFALRPSISRTCPTMPLPLHRSQAQAGRCFPALSPARFRNQSIRLARAAGSSFLPRGLIRKE